MITAFPTPTPSAGVPLEYAAVTIAPPPVAKTLSHCAISSLVKSSEGISIPITKSAGAPQLSKAALIRSHIFLLVNFALG